MCARAEYLKAESFALLSSLQHINIQNILSAKPFEFTLNVTFA